MRSPVRRPEPVADAADRLDEARAAGVVAELAAQVPDVHLEHVLVTLEVEPPGGVEELLTGEHDAGVAPERLEDRELEGGQLHGSPADGDLAARRVDDEVGDPEHAVALRAGPGRRRRRSAWTRATSSPGENGLVR